MRHLSLGIIILLAGWSSIFGPDEKKVVGIIAGLETDAPAVEVPTAVEAGEEFTITVQTTWHNGCARMDSAEVRPDGLTVTVTPYDVVTEGGICADVAQQFTHSAILMFSTPGAAEVIIRGRPSRNAEVTAVRRTVTVQ